MNTDKKYNVAGSERFNRLLIEIARTKKKISHANEIAKVHAAATEEFKRKREIIEKKTLVASKKKSKRP